MIYYIYYNQQQLGPLSVEEIGQYNISPTTKVWREDQDTWKDAIEFEELQQFFLKTPPPLEIIPPPIELGKNHPIAVHPHLYSEQKVNEEKKYIEKNGFGAREKQPMFKRLFSFKGRIRRLEYGLSMLIYFIYVLPMELIDENDLSQGFAIFWLLLFIPMVWFNFAQGAKRCHDRGNSGWFQIIPFYGLWMLFAEGDLGKNEYGDNPKGEGNISY